jgi:hypothetical protein
MRHGRARVADTRTNGNSMTLENILSDFELLDDWEDRYRSTIGRREAIIAFGGLRLTGWIAWWIWGIAHIYFLISLRNRLIVATQWLWSYVTFERGARLITGMHPNPKRDGHGRRGDDSVHPLPGRRAA